MNWMRPRHFRHNPILDIRKGKLEVRDVRKLCRYLVMSGGRENEGSQYFQDAAAELIAAGVLHTLYVGSSRTLAGVESLFADHLDADADLLERMRGTKHLGGRVHPFIEKAVDAQLRREERAQCAVLSTVRRHLLRFRESLATDAASEPLASPGEAYDWSPDLRGTSVSRAPGMDGVPRSQCR